MKKILLFLPLLLMGCSNTTPPETSIQVTPTPVTVRETHVYALGDSLTAAYTLSVEDGRPAQLQTMLNNSGKPYVVINAGVSGDRSDQLLARLDRSTSDAVSGDIAIVMIGANDAFQGVATSVIKTNITAIIKKLKAKNLRVALAQMYITTNLGPSYIKDFAAVYPAVAAQTNVPLIPFALSGVAGIPSLNISDGIHPTKEGYTIVAHNFFTWFEGIGW